MHWNYRVMFFDGEEPYYAIHEVYYNEDGTPEGYAQSSADIVWEGQVEAGLEELRVMQVAFTKPVLRPEDFGVTP